MKTANIWLRIRAKALVLLVLTHSFLACQDINPTYANPPTPPTPDNVGIIRIGLLLDTSNSMDGLINQAKSQLWKLVNELSEASYSGQQPTLQIALYEYGNSGLSANNGYIRQVSPMTSDLDKISEYLFGLRTNGGDEYCGQVIQTAINQNNWNNQAGSLNIMFIAGNEPFTQGPINYHQACGLAKEMGITVNTIFCGPYDQGVSGNWKDGADLTGGQYMSLNQDQKTQFVATPYDSKLNALNDSLNTTYISYGRTGSSGKRNQIAQDNNARSYGSENSATRAISKSSGYYSNEAWDLVDAKKSKSFDASKVERKYLSEDLKKKSDKELEAAIKKQADRRAKFQREIKSLAAQREQFIAAERTRLGKSNTSLDHLMIEAIHRQGAARNFQFGSEATGAVLGPASVDFAGFAQLTGEVDKYRAKRMVDLQDFLVMSKQKNTVILDTRSKAMYDAKHLKGAIHLNFSDFTADKLAKLIPDKNTRILIYCNNNILADPAYFASKSMPLALNIPTFINLYGYGYKNLYELSNNVPIHLLEVEGTAVTADIKTK